MAGCQSGHPLHSCDALASAGSDCVSGTKEVALQIGFATVRAMGVRIPEEASQYTRPRLAVNDGT